MEASELMGSERWRRLDLADRIASGWTQWHTRSVGGERDRYSVRRFKVWVEWDSHRAGRARV